MVITFHPKYIDFYINMFMFIKMRKYIYKLNKKKKIKKENIEKSKKKKIQNEVSKLMKKLINNY